MAAEIFTQSFKVDAADIDDRTRLPLDPEREPDAVDRRGRRELGPPRRRWWWRPRRIRPLGERRQEAIDRERWFSTGPKILPPTDLLHLAVGS